MDRGVLMTSNSSHTIGVPRSSLASVLSFTITYPNTVSVFFFPSFLPFFFFFLVACLQTYGQVSEYIGVYFSFSSMIWISS